MRVFFAIASLLLLELSAAGLDSLIEASPFVPEGFGALQPDRGPVASTQEPIEKVFELRGVLSLGNRRVYSIHNVRDKSSMWLEENAASGGFFPEILSYDPNERRARVRLGDREAELSIAEMSWSEVSFSQGGGSVSAGEIPPVGVNGLPPAPVVRGRLPVDRSTSVRDDSLSGRAGNAAPVAGDPTRRSVSLPGAALAPPSAPRPFIGGRRVAPSGGQSGSGGGVQNSDRASNPDSAGVSPAAGEGSAEATDDAESTVGEDEVVLDSPEEGPPPPPVKAAPVEVPQLPPGFDLEAFLRERAERARQASE